jgi:hypothetical protein
VLKHPQITPHGPGVRVILAQFIPEYPQGPLETLLGAIEVAHIMQDRAELYRVLRAAMGMGWTQ